MKDEGLALVLLAIAAVVAGGGGFAFREYVTDGDRWQSSTPRAVEQMMPAPHPEAAAAPGPVAVNVAVPPPEAARAADAAPPVIESRTGRDEVAADQAAPVPPPMPPRRTVPEPAPESGPSAPTTIETESRKRLAHAAQPAEASEPAQAPEQQTRDQEATPAVGAMDEEPAEQPSPAETAPAAPPATEAPPVVARVRPETPESTTDAAETFSDASAPTKRGHTFASAQGLLPYPAEGRIVGRFGADAGGGLTSKGITLAAPARAPVVAPYDGHIAYAGSFRGYGRVLIIDHDNGYHSLLAGLEDTDGTVSQWVLAGEPIETIAANADADRALYVEFWHDGEPVDPLPWLAPTRPRMAEATSVPPPSAAVGDGDEAGSLARLERLAAAAALDAERTRIFRSLPRPGTAAEPPPETPRPDIDHETASQPGPGQPETAAAADAPAERARPVPDPAEHAAVETDAVPATRTGEPDTKHPSMPKAVDPPKPEPATAEPPTGTEDPPETPSDTVAPEAKPKSETPETVAATEPETDPAVPEATASPTPEPKPEPADSAPDSPASAPSPQKTAVAVASAYRIQVAAMRSAEAADQEWQRLLAKNRDILGSFEMNVTPVDLGAKGTFYRIRAGTFADRAAARAVCAALAERRVPCLVVAPGS